MNQCLGVRYLSDLSSLSNILLKLMTQFYLTLVPIPLVFLKLTQFYLTLVPIRNSVTGKPSLASDLGAFGLLPALLSVGRRSGTRQGAPPRWNRFSRASGEMEYDSAIMSSRLLHVQSQARLFPTADHSRNQ